VKFQQQKEFYLQRLQRALSLFLNQNKRELHQAIVYSVLNGGKRIRALLVYQCGEVFNANLETLDYIACAVEFVHAYSLIHDDLPAMDNADLRRGLPSCHKAFGEAMAILAGDALLPMAFELLAKLNIAPSLSLTMIQILAHACGPSGMVGGQVRDLNPQNEDYSLTQIESLYQEKTGALIHAAIKMAALAGDGMPNELILLDQFSHKLGLAFQIQDDILDIEMPTEQIGKKQGQDRQLNKQTYPAKVGLTQAKKQVEELFFAAMEDLQPLDRDTLKLIALTQYILGRDC
jgi:geranylgeranyl pyrophosphate synthase